MHGLAREAAKAKATAKWRQMGVRSVHEALGIYTHDVHRRWGSVFWRSWARVSCVASRYGLTPSGRLRARRRGDRVEEGDVAEEGWAQA